MRGKENCKMVKYKNETAWPRKFTAKFLEPGLVSYEDIKEGNCLLTKETIDKYLENFLGKPVVISHPEEEVTPQNFDKYAVGYVTDVYYNPEDGWYYCRGLLTKDEGKRLVEKGFSVSCAYSGNSIARNGTWHNIPYQSEIIDLEFEHLGLVEKPRYEGCRIYLNSKNNKTGENTMNVLKLFSRKTNAEAAPAEAKPVEIDENATVDIKGKKVSLKELKAFYEAEMLEKAKQEELMENELDGESEVELSNGSRVKLNEMVEAYSKKNGCEPVKKENAEGEEPKEEGEEPKGEKKTLTPHNSAPKSAPHFNILHNAKAEAEQKVVYKNSFSEKLARGASRYGSAKEVK